MKCCVKRLLVFTLVLFMTWLPSIHRPIKADAASQDAGIDFSTTRQIIRGYGAASVWCGALSDSYMNKLYSDIGLSILRVRIAPNEGWNSGNYSAWADELSNAKKAKARGATVFASPWTPPASMKTNNSLIGGQLKESSYWDYANYLKTFADHFANNGASLYAISLQNEPDYVPSDYEGCGWSAIQFLNFIKYYGSPVVGATKIIMPESFGFNHAMSDATLNDSSAASRVSIIGGHLYGATIRDYPLARSKGKEVWMTEHLLNDQSIGGVMTTAKEIHDCMTIGNMNAYVWWWIISDANGLYNKSGQIQKRAYMLGQFAKYIRPGYYRVNATYSPQT
ncbi:MAG: glucuronoxylanase XynC, partial [Clostridiales bacterium]|nr:glucuronoxylanase XynC [Clostridiales bacterium]